MKGKEYRIALKNVGRIDPTSLAEYEAAGGIATLQRSLQLSPEKIIDEMTSAKLRGRGGAGFSAGLKERYTSESPTDRSNHRYIVCNADEGEPGTFKDRVIMENDPHLLIEGIIIAAYAIGAGRGFIYIRGEYYLCIKRIKKAVHSFYQKGYLGENILGSNFSLELSVKLGAGSYLCGEELTLLESLEGKRGYPRIKPPFPAEHGLWGAPTLINNVETFAHIPYIIEKGAAHYLTLGTKDSPGTKIFTLSGDINRPGYCETELGITLRELIEEFGQGMRGSKKFKAALLGGAAGTFVDSTVLDTPMTYDDLKKRGAVLGSGAVMVLAEDRSIYGMTVSILEFFRHESCGKCVPCRVGTRLLTDMIAEVREKKTARQKMLGRMVDEAHFMADASLCPLGQSPILPLESLARYFKKDF
ncbi:MAG: NADH-ubiquinone oxidoreductase-F iron-sulfur binding region domain-containing protein [Desulforhopalus sp.]